MLMMSHTPEHISATQDQMLAGLIPQFLMTAERAQTSTPFDADAFMQDVFNSYGFPCYPLDGHIENTVYQYHGDPDMHPLFTYAFKDPSFTVYQYHYGIVAFVYTQNGESKHFITRMD